MKAELFSYLILLIMMFYYALVDNGKYDSIKSIIVLCSILIYIVIVRQEEPQYDILNYSMEFEHSIGEMKENIYYLREFVFWFSASFLHNLFGNINYTLVFIDIVGLFYVLKTAKNFGIPYYYIYLFYLSFPGVMGLQNIYRQFLAIIFFIYSLSILFSNHKRHTVLFYFFISLFIHNSIALFFPIYFIIEKNNTKLAVFISIILIALLLSKLGEYKSQFNTGMDLSYIYTLVCLILFIFIYYNSQKKKGIILKKINMASLYLLMLSVLTLIKTNSGESERISMMCLQIMIIFVCLYIELFYKKNMKIFRVLLSSIFVLPTFIFDNAFNFLINKF